MGSRCDRGQHLKIGVYRLGICPLPKMADGSVPSPPPHRGLIDFLAEVLLQIQWMLLVGVAQIFLSLPPPTDLVVSRAPGGGSPVTGGHPESRSTPEEEKKCLPGFSDGGLEYGKFYSVRDAGMAWGGKVVLLLCL